MDKDKHRLQVTLTESLYQRLKAAAESQSISMSAAVNVAVTEYVRKIQRKNKTDTEKENT